MKRSVIRSRKSPELPIAWSKAGYAALKSNPADAYDDRVSDDIFDFDDERAEVDIIVHGMIQEAN